MAEKYLYGASVQGIQSFIFQTNELKDIVGASELVEQICTDMFTPFKKGGEIVVNAAGNVKCIYSSREECANAVLNFPKAVMEAAPGITISQAVVELPDGDEGFADTVNRLEAKLREQRNRHCASLTTGLLGMKRSPSTGFPEQIFDDGTVADASTQAKKKANNVIKLSQKSFFGKESGVRLVHDVLPFNISDITDKNDWIAIVHVDGNSLGQVVQAVGHKKEEYRRFSEALDKATEHAANDAYSAVKPEQGWNAKIPIRPVVLSGDDMTVIIRGDLALPYTKEFIKKFEKYTGEGDLGRIISDNKVFSDGTTHLSACAGIAYVKSSYPFYFGYGLAEELCCVAKSTVKKGLRAGQRIKSCVMFHKIQDSFVTSYSDIVERELKPSGGPSLQFGPYFINEEDVSGTGKMTVGQLLGYCERLDEFEGVRTGLRQWLTLLHDGSGRAVQHLFRLKDIQKDERAKKLISDLTNEVSGAVPVEDCLSIYTIINQKTKDD